MPLVVLCRAAEPAELAVLRRLSPGDVDDPAVLRPGDLVGNLRAWRRGGPGDLEARGRRKESEAWRRGGSGGFEAWRHRGES